MNVLAEVLKVLRALIDAAFSSGGINDTQHAQLHGRLNEVDPAVAEAKAKAEAGLTPEEQADFDRLEAKRAAAAQATPAPATPVVHTTTPTIQATGGVPGNLHAGFRG